MVDLSAFRRACREAAGRTRGEVTEFRLSGGTTPNFHQGIIDYSHRPAVAVFLARDTAVVAIGVPRVIDFTETPVLESGPLTFVDFPELATALTDTGTFRILTLAELHGPFDATEWPSVSSHDLDIWKPASLGEALFHYWD